jgi:hypothetical protein
VYNNQILNLNNKIKTGKNIITSETGRQNDNRDVSNNQQLNPDSFNNYLSVAEKIIQKEKMIIY